MGKIHMEKHPARFMGELDLEWEQCCRELVSSPVLEVFSQ